MASLLEVYNEQLRDLLRPETSAKLEVHEVRPARSISQATADSMLGLMVGAGSYVMESGTTESRASQQSPLGLWTAFLTGLLLPHSGNWSLSKLQRNVAAPHSQAGTARASGSQC